MDWRMPVMDGVEAASRIRRLPNGKEVKIVAVTASAFKEQLPELSVAGMDDYVRKPYRFREIYDILTRQLGLEFVYRTEPQTVSARPFLPTPAQLQAITAEQRDKLHAALEALDSTQIAAAIEEIGTVDAGLAQILTQLANEFDYPSMLGLLDAEFTDQ
jgi:CheY-like chemotaxis protein